MGHGCSSGLSGFLLVPSSGKCDEGSQRVCGRPSKDSCITLPVASCLSSHVLLTLIHKDPRTPILIHETRGASKSWFLLLPLGPGTDL